ncbi:MAG: penicillin-insensitive murein endopeptidase [Nannocystaceae bacterium]|nr:penicillin-insensitive murein endopeptidase [Nannocystaceae bacterium]
MAQHEAKIVGRGRVVGASSGIPGAVPGQPPPRKQQRPKRKRSLLYYVMLWLGLVAIAAAVMVGITQLPKAKDALVAVTSRSRDAPAEGSDAGTVAAEEGAGDAASEASIAGSAADEVESVEIPAEAQTEDPDDETLRDVLAAELPEGVKVVAPSPEPDVGTPVLEKVSGADEWIVHKMAPQETVSQVAHRYGVKVGSLRIWNGIPAEKEKLRRGARLKVKARQIPPPRRRVEYVVQPGDTWLSIAVTFGIDTRALRAQNWEASKNFVAGTVLSLWIDPLVYYWIKWDHADADSEDPVKNTRRGAIGVGTPQDGRLINGVQIPEGKGFTRRMLPSSYGTTHAVTSLMVALRDFEAKWPYEPALVLGSMSVKHGGPLEGHKSHQTGRDLDVRLPLDASVPNWFPIQPHRIDYKALWFLVVALADTGEVTIIFLDYGIQEKLFKVAAGLGVPKEERRRMLQWPRGHAAHRGLVRHASGHAKHLHVRFRCGPQETECVEKGSASSGI